LGYWPLTVNSYNKQPARPKFNVGFTGPDALSALITSSAKVDGKLANALDERDKVRRQFRLRDRDGGASSSLQALAKELRQKNKTVLDMEFATMRQLFPEDTLLWRQFVFNEPTAVYYHIEPKDEAEAKLRNIGTVRAHFQKNQPAYRAKLTELDDLLRDVKRLEEDLAIITLKEGREKVTADIGKLREKIRQARQDANKNHDELLRQALIEVNATLDFHKTDLLIATHLGEK
jgi:hypothetical protein